MSSTFRTARSGALSLACRGWPVLPCHHPAAPGCSCGDHECSSPAKHPRTRQGLHDATTDPAIIDRWWRQWPDANVGVRTGASPAGAGVVVLDVDPAHGGDDTLAALTATHGTLPLTLAAVTGGGGRHFWFAHPGGPVANSAGRLGPGLDIRGDGGYVLVSPSRHRSGGRYHWQSAPLAAMPSWLLEQARPPAPAARPHPPVRSDVDAWVAAALTQEIAAVRASVEGTRNHTLNRAAFNLGQLVAGGHLDEHDVTSHLTAAATAAGLGARETAATIHSGLHAGMRHPRTTRTA